MIPFFTLALLDFNIQDMSIGGACAFLISGLGAYLWKTVLKPKYFTSVKTIQVPKAKWDSIIQKLDKIKAQYDEMKEQADQLKKQVQSLKSDIQKHQEYRYNSHRMLKKIDRNLQKQQYAEARIVIQTFLDLTDSNSSKV